MITRGLKYIFNSGDLGKRLNYMATFLPCLCSSTAPSMFLFASYKLMQNKHWFFVFSLSNKIHKLQRISITSRYPSIIYYQQLHLATDDHLFPPRKSSLSIWFRNDTIGTMKPESGVSKSVLMWVIICLFVLEKKILMQVTDNYTVALIMSIICIIRWALCFDDAILHFSQSSFTIQTTV